MEQSINLINDDCMNALPRIADNSVDLVLVDPPYGTTNCKWDTPLPLEVLWAQLRRITKDNAAIVIMAQAPFDKVLACSNLKEFRYEWIWEKTNATGHLNAKKMPMKAHEVALVFYRELPTYNPQKTRGHTRKTASSDRAKAQGEVYGTQKGVSSYDSTDRYPRSVQVFAKDKQKSPLHPTQKPVALMEYLIKTYSNEGDSVLDFTMGSGTTGVACVNAGRSFTGVELEADYFDIARARIEGIQQNLELAV